MTFCLEGGDEQLEENRGMFSWTVDRHTSVIRRVLRETAAKKSTDGSPVIRIHIRELTSWLFGYHIPENLPAGTEDICPLGGVFLDEVV